VELRRGHLAAEGLPRDELAEEGIGVEEHLVGEDDVVDADDALLAQFRVVDERRPLVEREVQAEVGVVVEVRAGGDDPVDEAGLDERDDAGDADAGGGEGAGQGHADRDAVADHLLGEEAAGVAQAAAVVGEEMAVDQFLDGESGGDGVGEDALPLQEFRHAFTSRGR
jgi:hypothetical protein